MSAATTAINDLADTLERLAARARQLFSLPTIAVKVMELTANPQVDTHALKECIENDPALTTKVLRVVNSSLFGLSREVSDLNQALALLGSKPLKLLVLGFSLPSGLFMGVAGGTLGWYWRHTLTKAVAAREISERVWHQPGDEAFIVGLLQDLGVLLLIQELGGPFAEFLDKIRVREQDLLELENELMGFNHTMLTARLLRHWGFPESLTQSVVAGTDGELGASLPPAQERLVEIVRLAELIARLVADGHFEVFGQLLARGEREHNLTPQGLQELVEALEEKVRQLADVLSLQLPRGVDYRDVLAHAHAQLAEVAASAAVELVDRRHGESRPAAANPLSPEETRSLTAALARLGASHSDSAAGLAEPPEAASARPVEPRKSAVSEADPRLLGKLSAAVTACRQSRWPLSLLLVDLGQAEDLLMSLGPEGFAGLHRFLEKACREVDHPSATYMPLGESAFAIILPDCERQTAVRLGNQLIDRVRYGSVGRRREQQPKPQVGVGAVTVSLPPRNFPATDLLVAADRCLYGSHASGGGVVKSLEIY